MGWIYLLLGGLFEMGWPVGMKLAQTNDTDRYCLCRVDRNRSSGNVIDRDLYFW